MEDAAAGTRFGSEIGSGFGRDGFGRGEGMVFKGTELEKGAGDGVAGWKRAKRRRTIFFFF